MIETKHLIKKYGKKTVVNDASLKIPQGKLIAFIGSNGAGKSTLISLISRTLARDSGEVLVDGKALSNWKNDQLAKRLSILKQSNHLNIRLTVRELVEFGRFPHSKGRMTAADKQKVDSAIEYLGLQNFEERFLDELSGGQRQMAYIAMILAQDTEYVFLDEPLNNLDMRHAVKIMEIMRKMVDEMGKTVMVVIHDINFVSCYSDYLIAMKDGTIQYEGKTNSLLVPPVLKDIFGIDINIEEFGGNKICLYYKQYNKAD